MVLKGEMIGFVQKIARRQKLKKNLLAFLAEMEKNLETFYVMDQRQFITGGFLTRAWDQIKDEALIKKHASILVYIRAIEDVNRMVKEHKEFEQWYAADMNNKTPDNARKLHGMKNDLDKKLKTMEAVIIPAGQALEREMLQLGMLRKC